MGTSFFCAFHPSSNFWTRMDSKLDECEWEMETNTSQWRLIPIASFQTIWQTATMRLEWANAKCTTKVPWANVRRQLQIYLLGNNIWKYGVKLTCKRQIAPDFTQTHSSIGDYGNSPKIMNESGNLNFNEALCLYCKIVRNRSFSCVLKQNAVLVGRFQMCQCHPELDGYQQAIECHPRHKLW
jgi:hypothetical protein